MSLRLGSQLGRRQVIGGGSGGGGGTLTDLYWLYNGGRTFENTTSGVSVGAIQGKQTGSTLTIVSVTTSTGTVLASSSFSISGATLNTGTTALDYETVGLVVLVTIRETLGASTKDTVLPVWVYDLPEAGSLYSENFDIYPNGTTLRSLSGWTGAVVSGTNASQDLIATLSGELLSGGDSTNIYKVMRQAGSTDVEVTFTSKGTASASGTVWARYTNNTNHVFGVISSTGRDFSIRKRSTSSGSTNILATYTPLPGFVIPAGAIVGMRLVGGRVYMTYNGAVVMDAAGYDCSDVPLIDAVGFTTSVAAAWPIDNLTVQAITGFSISNLDRVYPVNEGTQTAIIPLRGGYNTSAAPASLEYRVETAGATLISDWAALGATISNGSWRKLVELPKNADNLVIKVRDPASPATVLTSAEIGVGYVINVYGQSNAARLDDVYAPAVNSYGNKVWGYISNSIQSPAGRATAGLGNKLYELLGAPIQMINTAVGGASAAQLAPGTANYTASINALRTYSTRLNAVLIDQGEADAGGLGTSNDPSTWSSQWLTTITKLAADHGQQLGSFPVLISQSLGQTDTASSLLTNRTVGYLVVRRAQRLLASLNSAFVISHHKFDADYQTGEDIHHSYADQYNKLGPRFAYALAKKLGYSTFDRLGPKVTATSKSGNVITLTLDGNGASSITDTASGGSLAQGFQVVGIPSGYTPGADPESYFTNVANIVAVSGVTYTSTTITVTCASNPGTNYAIRYAASTSNATGTTLFDGTQPFGQPYGVTGQIMAAQIKGVYSDQNVGLAPFAFAA